jgi:hypothetical protein
MMGGEGGRKGQLLLELGIFRVKEEPLFTEYLSLDPPELNLYTCDSLITWENNFPEETFVPKRNQNRARLKNQPADSGQTPAG